MPESAVLAPAPAAADPCLLPVERRLLLRLARGIPRGALSSAEGLTLATVDRHLAAIYTALGVETATGAVVAGHEQGLLPRDAYPACVVPADLQPVLELIAASLPDRAIAARLGLTTSTARVRVDAVYGALKAANRPNCVHIAYCVGVLGGAK